MGRILAYLGKTEKNQSEDTLQAERLLEGMQMLYASAPDGGKKDFLAMTLAEMTKTFIEKLKSPEAPEEEFEEVDLPFKVGDVFMLASEQDNPISTFTIKDINFEDNKVSYQKKVVKASYDATSVKTELIVDVAENIENGFWITFQNVRPPQEPEPPRPEEPEPEPQQPEPQPVPMPPEPPQPPRPERKTKRKVDTEKQRIIKEVLNIDLDNIDI